MKKFGLILGIIVILLFVSQMIFLLMDDQASESFAIKADQLQIKGKTRKFVFSTFGPPAYEYASDGRTILVYVPGPKCAVWRHECKIGFDAHGLVDGWVVRSD